MSRVRRPGPPGSCSPVCTPCVWCRVYGVLGVPAPVHRCARSVCGVACTVSWASRLLFTGVHALCVVLRVRCPGPPGSCSPVRTLCVWRCVYDVLGLPAPVHRDRTLCVWRCVYGVLGLPAPVHRCARPVCGVACTVSWAPRLLFTVAHALRAVSCVRCPGPPGSCSPVCTPCVWCRVYGVLALLAPVHRCAPPVCCVACTASWASRLLFTGVHALCVVLCVRCPGPPGFCSPAYALRVALRVRRPGPPGSCSPVCTLCVWCCVYGVLGLPAPVRRCARPVCGVACTVSWAPRLLFTGAHALRVVLCVRRPGPPGSCSPVRRLCVWCCVYGVLGLLAPVHLCARSACGVACTASWASRLLFTDVHALCVVLRVRCPGLPGSCSLVRTPCVWCCVYGVLGLPAPVHRCARSVCVCGVLGLPAPVHRCARLVCGGACTASGASRLPFTGVHALCVVVRVRCPGPFGSCSPLCTLCVWCCVYGVLGLPAPVHRCARPVRGVACAVWPFCARVVRVVLCVWCPGTLGSWSPVSLCVAVCVWCPVCGVACAVSWASRPLFTGARARCVAWFVRCGCGCVLACAIPWPRRCGLFVFAETFFFTHAPYGV